MNRLSIIRISCSIVRQFRAPTPSSSIAPLPPPVDHCRSRAMSPRCPIDPLLSSKPVLFLPSSSSGRPILARPSVGFFWQRAGRWATRWGGGTGRRRAAQRPPPPPTCTHAATTSAAVAAAKTGGWAEPALIRCRYFVHDACCCRRRCCGAMIEVRCHASFVFPLTPPPLFSISDRQRHHGNDSARFDFIPGRKKVATSSSFLSPPCVMERPPTLNAKAFPSPYFV